MMSNQERNREFAEAAEKGNFDKVKDLWKQGDIDINSKHHDMLWSALHDALRRDHKEIALFLLENGADPDDKTEGYQSLSCLRLAAQYCTDMVDEIISRLEKKYEDDPVSLYSALTHRDYNSNTAFYVARGQEVQTKIQKAIEKAVERLGKMKNIPEALLEDPERAIRLFKDIEREDLLEKFIEKLEKSSLQSGQPTLSNLKAYIHSAYIDSEGDFREKMRSKYDEVEKLIEAHNEFYKAALNGDLDEIKKLRKNYTINLDYFHPYDDWNALYVAAYHGREKVVAYLLKVGANPDLGTRNSTHSSALFIASRENYPDIARHIIKALQRHYKDDPISLYKALNYSDDYHSSPKEYLEEFGKAKKAIEDAFAQAKEGIAEMGELPEEFIEDPVFGLSILAEIGNENLIDQLLKHMEEKYKDDPKAFLSLLNDSHKDFEGTPEDIARENGHLFLANDLKRRKETLKFQNPQIEDFIAAIDRHNIETIKKYIETGKIDINGSFRDGQTPIYVAAREGYADIVEILLAAGADFEKATASEHISPLSIALYRGYSEIAEWLLEAYKEKYKNDPKALLKIFEVTDKHGNSLKKDAERGKLVDLLDTEIKAITDQMPRQKIAIVGGGLSGSATAIELLRKSRDQGIFLEITMIEKSPENNGGGLAYGEDNAGSEHIINIQAERMSPFVDKLDDFVRWLRHNHPELYENNQDAVPRPVYQQYISQKLKEELEETPHVKLVQKQANVLDLHERDDDAILELSDGTEMNADHVVLADGHGGQQEPDFIKKAKGSNRVLLGLWGKRNIESLHNMDKDATIFIIGTSMSAYDAVISLRKNGHQGKIIMMSRHGYMHPVYQKGQTPKPANLNRPEFLQNIRMHEDVTDRFGRSRKPRQLSVDEIINRFEKDVIVEWKKLTRQNRFSPEQILANWEQYIPDVVQTLLEAGVPKDRIADLLHKHKSLISTNRIGISPKIGDEIEQAILDGQVEVWQGNIEEIIPSKTGVDVAYTMTTPDGSKLNITKTFGYVVSCLGQEGNYTKTHSPLWKSLIEKGTVNPHWTRLGIDVGEQGQIVHADGSESDIVTAVGMMRVGDTTVERRDYVEKQGSGGRLLPLGSSVVGIRHQYSVAAQHILEELALRASNENNSEKRQVFPQP